MSAMTPFSHFLKGVFLSGNRRWVAMTLPPLLVGAAGYFLNWIGPKFIYGFLWQPSWKDYAISVLLGLLMAGYLVWLEEHRTLETKEGELVFERENLDGRPQIVLGSTGQGSLKRLCVQNRGGSDAIDVRLQVVNRDNYSYSSETIHHLSCGLPPCSIVMYADPQGDRPQSGGRIAGPDALDSLANDLWAAKHPQPDGLTDAETLQQAFDSVLHERITFDLNVLYKDLSGKSYDSQAVVVWNPRSGVIEIRPGMIRRKIA
jgi:hypothetical protein